MGLFFVGEKKGEKELSLIDEVLSEQTQAALVAFLSSVFDWRSVDQRCKSHRPKVCVASCCLLKGAHLVNVYML